MHKLRQFYYQNKEKIWKVVLIIVFLLGLIYFFNSQALKENVIENTSKTNSTSIYTNEQNNTYISDKSAISGGTVTEKEVQKINNTISKFLEYCKNGDADEAYNMLSNDCKENEYNTLEKFQNKYINLKFSKEAIYEIEKWIYDTYKVSISQDLLATGSVKENEKKTDYITIVEENDEIKLNINSYIGKQEINEEEIQDNIKITVLSKRTYMDCEIYDLKIENLSNKVIKIDSLEKTETMYVQDSNGNKYNAYTHEILEDNLIIRKNHKSNISITYSNSYSERIDIEEIVFEDVILDYVKYKKSENIEEFDNRSEIKIRL